MTFNELLGLGGGGLIAGGLASLGSFFLSTWWQLDHDFAFDPPKNPVVAAHWQGVHDMAFFAAIGSYLGAGLLLAVGGATVIKIILETKHNA